MSFFARNNPKEGDDYHYRVSFYKDDNADQLVEHRRSHSELPAEIPDSQPDPYLPAEIPDSQPDLDYYQDLPFGDPDYLEVSSQSPARGHGDLHVGDASAFDLGEYDLGEAESFNPGDLNLDDQENTDSRVNRFERIQPEKANNVLNEIFSSSRSDVTEIIPGGTQLTKRLKDRGVSLYYHPKISTDPLSIFFQSSQPQ